MNKIIRRIYYTALIFFFIYFLFIRYGIVIHSEMEKDVYFENEYFEIKHQVKNFGILPFFAENKIHVDNHYDKFQLKFQSDTADCRPIFQVIKCGFVRGRLPIRSGDSKLIAYHNLHNYCRLPVGSITAQSQYRLNNGFFVKSNKVNFEIIALGDELISSVEKLRKNFDGSEEFVQELHETFEAIKRKCPNNFYLHELAFLLYRNEFFDESISLYKSLYVQRDYPQRLKLMIRRRLSGHYLKMGDLKNYKFWVALDHDNSIYEETEWSLKLVVLRSIVNSCELVFLRLKNIAPSF